MNIFDFRGQLIEDYASYINSFIQIRDPHIHQYVEQKFQEGVLWPEPLIQLNPLFERGESIDELVVRGMLHRECVRIFRKGKAEDDPQGAALRLHKHQSEAIHVARGGDSYVLTTGTGSGKSLAYIIPIVDAVLRNGSGRGIQAIVVYPMNALANSQLKELEKFLRLGYPNKQGPVSFERYTGQESDAERERIIENRPDILLTNYVMLELILTRAAERRLIADKALRFLVLDELHTYRGRQGADVALLVRRVRDRLAAGELQCVGTSATLAGAGTYEEQRREVAEMASRIFGADVKPAHVIGETLVRTTSHIEQDEEFRRQLIARVKDHERIFSGDFQRFIQDPLAIWIEDTFGVIEKDGRLVRAEPKSITGERGAASLLSRLTGVAIEQCIEAIQQCLLAGYRCEPHPDTGSPPFAFRLHQFFSKGDTIYASLEEERYLTLQRQQFVPGDRERVLLPLVFCRECGQEYYCVRLKDGQCIPRELNDQQDDDGQAGFLYYNKDNPWPLDEDSLQERLPDEWLEEHRGGVRVRRNRRNDLPQSLSVRPDGTIIDGGSAGENGLDCHFLPAPFRFCLHCEVSYGFRQREDFAKLASLSSEGRSTATTVLSLSAIRRLREAGHTSFQSAIPPKLLSFTDNRQDASLQAGHFNDFIEVGVMRSALYRAVCDAGEEGLRHDELTQKVFTALNLPLEQYASDPHVKYQALAETQRAFRDVLGYHLYRDLKRGWRITSPNLEQCGLLVITYLSLDEVCHDEDVWQQFHEALSAATPEMRKQISKVLLDHMRRELAIKVNYLERDYQERLQQRSNQYLVAPWALDENESPEYATTLFPRGRGSGDDRSSVYLSARGGFGQYLRRRSTFGHLAAKLRLDDTDVIIEQLLTALSIAGLVEKVVEPRNKDEKPGYQLPASAMIWVAGNGSRAFHDPIRVPREPGEGRRTNPFFVEFYRSTAASLRGLEAREHTAQVPYDLREEREKAFRAGILPILYCSPTMELGIDIAELNLVNMRNVPPTPANYAQRSGRAGRSGQPALVFSYCSTGSPHDQYFFKRPELMVAGAVSPPRLDLANEDLVRAHVHAIWLAETHLSLGQSLKDILDVNGDHPTLALQGHVRESIEDSGAKKRARLQAARILETLHDELHASDWFTETWLDEVFNQITAAFDRTCERWRGLYRAAQSQAEAQDSIIRDASRSADDKKQAERLRAEAESQLKLLTDITSLEQSDFYSYRYFASEGFLPGYNFPRLPLSAYIPGRRTKQRDEYLSRPRFLAVSEFGPRAIVYHEGSRYVINRVILSVRDSEDVPTSAAIQCDRCGYLHPIVDGYSLDLCERCHAPLGKPLRHLFRLQNVATKRRDKINSDEEERMRQGFEIHTAVRFVEHDGRAAYRFGMVEREDEALVTLTYGHAATLWRINLGWQRRKNRDQYGFVLDMERGYWARNEQSLDDPDDPLSPRTDRVIPYVEDRRNCLLFEPAARQTSVVMASLQAILKSAIQVRYQLEDNELAAEPLPNMHERNLILLYESAEGGAGVLRRLLDEPYAISEVAKEALRLCHFDPETGADLRRAPRAQEACEAACYDCLMTYYNQHDHRLLDRQAIRDYLMTLTQARVEEGPTAQPRAEYLQQLLQRADSELERKWLRFLEAHGHRLPSHAQYLIEACGTRPDFYYEDYQAAIYIDGHFHEYPERQARDTDATECLEDLGYIVIRFGHEDDWATKMARYPNIFGKQAEV